MQTPTTYAGLGTAETRLKFLGFQFVDNGCYQRSDGFTLRLGFITEGLIIQPLDADYEPTQPPFFCEDDREFEQALLLLGAIAA
jgi:hypothetical protein